MSVKIIASTEDGYHLAEFHFFINLPAIKLSSFGVSNITWWPAVGISSK